MSTRAEEKEFVGSGLGFPHACSAEQILEWLSATRLGLSRDEVAVRLQRYGPNALPKKEPPGILQVFANQFKSPLIYVLVAAALVSLLIEEYSDSIFIGAVLLLNAVIGPFRNIRRSARPTHCRKC